MPRRHLLAALLAALTLASVAPAVGAAGAPTVTVEGTLELEVNDHADAHGRFIGPDTEEWFVRDAAGHRTKLTFPAWALDSLETGTKVRVTGHRTEAGFQADGAPVVEADAGVADGGTLADTGSTATASSPNVAVAGDITPVTKRLAVLLVNFASNPVQPYTVSYANGVIFANTSSVAAYYKEESFGTLVLTGDVHGWYTIKYDTSKCDTAAIQTAAEAAATAAGMDLTTYTNVMYVFPHLSACSFAGRAQLPGTRSWINTISTTTPKIHDWVVAHELGHNFGVNHASSLTCIASGVRIALSSSASNCTADEYGDPFSLMGAWNPIAKYPSTDAWQRIQSGFVAPSERQDVTASGLYLVSATNFASSLPKSIRVDRTGSTATRHWFEVEFRQPGTLFDGFASTNPVVNGATIRLVGSDSNRTQSWLIDTTPSTTSFSDAPLAVGRTFKDPLSKIAFTTKSIVTDPAGHPAIMVKVLFPNTVAPAAPGNLTATSSIDGGTATLSWDPAVSSVGVASYRVYRDDVLVATLPADATGYTDAGRTPSTTYAYKVQAVDLVDLVGAAATTSVTMFVPTLGTTTASFSDGTATLADTTVQTFTNASVIALGLHFSAPVSLPTPDALTLSGTATGCSVSAITGSGMDFEVSISGCSEGTVVATIVAGSVHDDLGYLAPALEASSDTVVIDRTAPVAKQPVAQLREDVPLGGSSLPVRIAIAGSDATAGVESFEVGRSLDGAAFTTLATGVTAASINTTLAPGHTYRFRVRALDGAGNLSPWKEGLLLKPGLVQESATAITFSGAWYTGKLDKYSGGAVRYSLTSGPSANYTFSGRGIALVTTKAAARGKLKVYIDGVYVRTVDLYRSSAAYRQVAFAQMFGATGTHTIKVVAVTTTDQPRVDLDAFAVIR